MILFKQQNSKILLFTGLMMLAIGLPLSLFLTSLAQFFIAGSFFIEGSIKEKWNRFLNNRLAILVVSIWLLHLLGLIWTSDLQEGLKDLRIKLPLLILPIVLAGNSPLSLKQFNWISITFVASVIVGSAISVLVFYGLIDTSKEIHDIRDIFIFNISHIRFSLFVCLAVFIVIHFFEISIKKKHYGKVIFQSVLLIWLVFFLLFIESITGLTILLTTLIVHLIIKFFKRSTWWQKLMTILLLITLPGLVAYQVMNIVEEYSVKHEYQIDRNDKTKKGNPYVFLTDNPLYENGYPIWVYVCDEELREDWNALSQIPYDSLDDRAQPIRYTLIRFLSSKGLKKDSEGLQQLNSAEINSVERGIANVKYQNLSNIKVRLIQVIWEVDQYRLGVNSGGHSVTQRLEFWQTACRIISANPMLGVGTGDMPTTYREEYIKMETQLSEKYRLRAHNQYLAIAVALGIPVLLFFIFVFVYSVLKKSNRNNFLYLSFWIIAILSMITEDTLETQSGVTFIALFLSLFSFSIPEKDEAVD